MSQLVLAPTADNDVGTPSVLYGESNISGSVHHGWTIWEELIDYSSKLQVYYQGNSTDSSKKMTRFVPWAGEKKRERIASISAEPGRKTTEHGMTHEMTICIVATKRI